MKINIISCFFTLTYINTHNLIYKWCFHTLLIFLYKGIKTILIKNGASNEPPFLVLKKLNIFTDESIEEWDDSKVKDWTEENIIEQLRKDVEFGFEKALNQRGISASIMFDIVLTWNQILENYLKDWNPEDYPMYGLPLFKATALLYGFDNPIGDDSGSEEYYNEEDYYYEDDDL